MTKVNELKGSDTLILMIQISHVKCSVNSIFYSKFLLAAVNTFYSKETCKCCNCIYNKVAVTGFYSNFSVISICSKITVIE